METPPSPGKSAVRRGPPRPRRRSTGGTTEPRPGGRAPRRPRNRRTSESEAPRLAASMAPGPPPVATVQARRGPACGRAGQPSGSPSSPRAIPWPPITPIHGLPPGRSSQSIGDGVVVQRGGEGPAGVALLVVLPGPRVDPGVRSRRRTRARGRRTAPRRRTACRGTGRRAGRDGREDQSAAVADPGVRLLLQCAAEEHGRPSACSSSSSAVRPVRSTDCTRQPSIEVAPAATIRSKCSRDSMSTCGMLGIVTQSTLDRDRRPL